MIKGDMIESKLCQPVVGAKGVGDDNGTWNKVRHYFAQDCRMGPIGYHPAAHT